MPMLTVGGARSTGRAQRGSVAPPAGDVFAMDYTSGGARLASMDTGPSEPSAQIVVTRQAAIGPASEDGYRYTFATGGSAGGDFGFGWYKLITGAPFAYNDSVFFRFKYRLASGTNGRFYEQGDTGALSGDGKLKFMIVNNASSGTTSRFICNLNIERSPLVSRWTMSKGGGTDFVYTGDITVDTNWRAVQIELQYSSVANAADGAYRLWIDNTTQGSPTISATSIVLNADVEPGNVALGAYLNNSLYSDGVFGLDHVGFAIKDSFTAGWSV